MNEILMCGTDPVGQLYKDTKAEATSIAPIEVSPAESSHSVGTHIMVDGVRYKVTSAISVGDTLTIGTNISAENIEDNLNATHIPYDSNISVKEKIDSPIDIKRTQSATAVLSVGGTMQLNSDIMGCKVIILTVGRYGYGDTKVFPVSRITDGAFTEGCTFWSDNAGAWVFKISTTGLITYKTQVGGVGEPFIVAFGI